MDRQINNVKMAILLDVIWRFNIIPHKNMNDILQVNK